MTTRGLRIMTWPYIFWSLIVIDPESLVSCLWQWTKDWTTYIASTGGGGQVLKNGGFLKWGYPKMAGLQWKILPNWMIWYHYCRKPPYVFQ